MSSPSNLYAEKAFSEHPMSLWALDDKVDYLSLISENDRNLENWNISGGTVESNYNILQNTQPFIDSAVNVLYGDVIPEGELGEIVLITDQTINGDHITAETFNSVLKTFALGFYLYAENPYLSSVAIGYRYLDNAIHDYVEPETKWFNSLNIENRWLLVSNTFDASAITGNIELIIKIRYSGGGATIQDNKFMINGLSMGQWSENFLSESLGIDLINLPNNIPLTNTKCVQANAYGLQNSPGYYLASDNYVFAKNASLPMVYGTSNVTIIFPNPDGPSLIVPGYGFMGEYGRYNDLTLEAWLKISSDTTTPKRIIGPIASETQDGLYVDGSFLGLKIGNSYGSYHVSEWGRPMLVHIKLSQLVAEVLINGESVITISIDESHQYANRYDGSIDNDWIGFYAYEDASPMEIDCVAIYPYLVSQIVAKRRLVYGQAVEIPENLNRAYSGTSTIFDYQFSKYANNYLYPDFGKWENAIMDNLISTNGQLSIPNYKVPDIVFNNKTKAEWSIAISSEDLQTEDHNFISLRPNSAWSNTDGYLLFSSLDLLSSDTKGIYGIFKQRTTANTQQTLIKILDEATSSYFEIRMLEDSIEYILKYEDQEEVVYATQKYYPEQTFTVGLDIDNFVKSFGGNLISFFGRKSGLSVYVGGNKDFTRTFTGSIYNVSFCSARNLSAIISNFDENGIIKDNGDEFILLTEGDYDGGSPSTDTWSSSINPDSQYTTPAVMPTVNIIDHIASYTAKLNEKAGIYFLDIFSNAYWEDYVPLTYLSKYTIDANGNKVYDIDFIQFNINYPAPGKYVEVSSTPSTWNYAELLEQYSQPIQRTYDQLDNHLFTGYNDYQDLAEKTTKNYVYNTNDQILKSYVTFQLIRSGFKNAYSYFSDSIPASRGGLIIPGENGEDWWTTKYEVVDGMIIYPPKGISLSELAIVMHLEISVDGIASKPLKIRKLQLASQALDHTSPTPIGTRLGQDVFPYRKTGLYFNYKGFNPFSIYKGSSPHLYLTKNSGIEIKGDYDPAVNRGISIPVNSGLATDYKVIAMQMSLQYNKDFFPFGATKIFEIEGKNSYIKFYAVANHPNGKRAKIYAINAKTGRRENGIAFYWNGKLTKEPNITIKEWGMLGIRFSNSIDYTNFKGAIRLTGPFLFNNISQYQSTNLQEVQEITKRPWLKVKLSNINEIPWSFWENSFIWNGVLVISETSFYGVDPSNIYKAYTGTNKIIVDDPNTFRFNDYEYSVILVGSTSSYTMSPL
jgi:hypothetical protein